MCIVSVYACSYTPSTGFRVAEKLIIFTKSFGTLTSRFALFRGVHFNLVIFLSHLNNAHPSSHFITGSVTPTHSARHFDARPANTSDDASFPLQVDILLVSLIHFSCCLSDASCVSVTRLFAVLHCFLYLVLI